MKDNNQHLLYKATLTQPGFTDSKSVPPVSACRNSRTVAAKLRG